MNSIYLKTLLKGKKELEDTLEAITEEIIEYVKDLDKMKTEKIEHHVVKIITKIDIKKKKKIVYETNLLDLKKAIEFRTWFSEKISTEFEMCRHEHRYYFILFELSQKEVMKINRYFKD